MAKPTSVRPDPSDQILIDLAAGVLSEFFFDPDNEEAYRNGLGALRASSRGSARLGEMTLDLSEGECVLRVTALRTPGAFSVSVEHPAFGMTVEGFWDFEQEELRKPKVTGRRGSRRAIRSGAEAIMEDMQGPDLDAEEVQDLMALLEETSEQPRIGDDPKEPPPATALDRTRVKAIAKRAARKGEPAIEDTGWLEQTPQVLPVIADLLVAEAAAGKRNESLIAAYSDLLGQQLEYVRYRLDAGWEWAARMLDDYQNRLIALGEANTIPQADWAGMARALTEARVPVADNVQAALASAGLSPEDVEPDEDMLATLRGFLNQLAGMVTSPADVVESMKASAAMMPADLRGFLATEMALSPHRMLRDSVPLMLLDADSVVRRNAALALEQSARPDTLSPDALRRAIAVRNWLPPADRPGLDGMIRKARLAGVEIGVWPTPSAGLEYHATMIDGSGAQSLLAVDRSGEKGVFAGLLLRHGEGIADAWGDSDLPRRDINGMMRDAQMQSAFTAVRKSYMDALVQHAIGTAVDAGKAPPGGLLTIADMVGGADWKDRRLDIAAEAERMWRDLPAADRSPEGIGAGFERGLAWMAKDQIISSWFEDGPKVRDALAPFSRSDREGMLGVVVRDILPAARARWAERFVLMAMWCEAAVEAKHRARLRDLAPVAHALTGDAPMEEIPIMAMIAGQTVMAVLSGGW